MQARITRTAVACVLLVALVGALSFLGSTAPAADEPETTEALELRLRALLADRVKSAERCLEATQVAYEAETVTLDVLLDAVSKLAEAQLEASPGPQREIAALEAKLAHMQAIEKRIYGLYEAGVRGGEAKDYSAARRERETAEIALVKARLKARRDQPAAPKSN